MTLYYSQSNVGFYDDQIHSRLPEDAVAISLEQHAALLAGQSNGQVIMPGKNGKPVLADPAPCPSSTWDGTQWQIDPECAARLKAEQQDEMWERIKAKRAQSRHAGIYINSLKKWMHSDADSRMQYTFLRTLDKLPEDQLWKTVDNSFVPMTRELLDELTLKLISDEQHDFQNAERHKAAMLKAENPLDYDYSGGWSAADLMKEAANG
ncbi:DUF4376 domain-containing protein [Kingella oralis]|uniref:DUF4376 domain-containing protein n=1 Tax=Kingella oralis TaxID=505 RepID=UPI0020616322|nr:MAG TPA: protein of unknown function (DUF4376) [Caudoviricetes sp.]DAT16942.1 MAG TPA: protein of unknown function (DUF4376) [Caudoviricetes sp.]DAY00677.1 MAG TPA: protein of unknown function (DUF4376) [Caudoviricetes sp.]